MVLSYRRKLAGRSAFALVVGCLVWLMTGAPAAAQVSADQIINALAPSFGGQKNDVQALKATAYSSTAAWLGGAFNLIPALALIGILVSLYSLYLLYAGLPVVMKTPKDKALGYTVVVIIAVIVVFLIIGAVSAAFLPGYSGLEPRV